MEESCSEQGGDSSLANDWRTQHEPDLRERVTFAIVEKLKIYFHQVSENDIKNTAIKFEDRMYDMATNKDDYLWKVSRKVFGFHKKYIIVSSDDKANTTPDPDYLAYQALNQGQSLPTSLPYKQMNQQLPCIHTDCTGKTLNTSGGDWREETYQKLPKPMACPARMSPSASSPQMHNYSSPLLVEQQSLATPLNKAAPPQEHPMITLPPEPITERPIDRLIKAFQSSSPRNVAQSVSEMRSVISLADMLPGVVHPTGGSRGRLGEDLSERTRFRVQQASTNPTKRFKRSFTATPLDSTASSAYMIEPGCALLQEIIEINGRLVETLVNICNEDFSPSEVTTTSGTVVTCSYVPVALSATFKALYNSGHLSQIQPLRLLVPESYPCTPIILEKALFDGASVHKHEDLSARARSRFGLSMKEYSEPMSLKKIAQVWEECARATMVEYAERHGGGTFSSKYGHWESVLRAS